MFLVSYKSLFFKFANFKKHNARVFVFNIGGLYYKYIIPYRALQLNLYGKLVRGASKKKHAGKKHLEYSEEAGIEQETILRSLRTGRSHYASAAW